MAEEQVKEQALGLPARIAELSPDELVEAAVLGGVYETLRRPEVAYYALRNVAKKSKKFTTYYTYFGVTSDGIPKIVLRRAPPHKHVVFKEIREKIKSILEGAADIRKELAAISSLPRWERGANIEKIKSIIAKNSALKEAVDKAIESLRKAGIDYAERVVYGLVVAIAKSIEAGKTVREKFGGVYSVNVEGYEVQLPAKVLYQKGLTPDDIKENVAPTVYQARVKAGLPKARIARAKTLLKAIFG